MVYFLGRDVQAAITTEHGLLALSVSGGNAYLNNVLLAQVASINASTDIITCAAAHGLSDGDPFTVTMDADASIGMGLTAGTVYYANAPSTTTLSAHTTRATGISGASKESLTDSEATTTNITREIVGTSASSDPDTFIFNRNWPQYDGTGRIDTITADSTTPTPLVTAATDQNKINDLVGIDLTLGKVDEDIAYFGQRTALKAEIKNECTLVLTMKKSDQRWEVLYNQARDGVISYTTSDKVAIDVDALGTNHLGAGTKALPTETSCQKVHGGQDTSAIGYNPKQNHGYRLHLQLKSGASGEIITLRNMCISDYSVSFNVDGVTEETITFYGYVEPKLDVNTSGYATVTPAADL